MGRRLGQHFLVRQSILESIALSACPGQCETVVEIGPGRGALTGHLLARAARVVAIEIDQVLVQYLRAKFRGAGGLEVLEADVLKTDLSQWGRVTVAGNLPYYITSPILDRVLSLGPLLQSAVFLVQREVADRLVAVPGTRAFGYLSVQTQVQSQVEMLFTVPAGAFQPPPKVDSALVRLTPRAQPLIDDLAAFLGFVSVCFQHKRKTLRNNLAARYSKAQLDQFPIVAKRAEQLSLADLIALFRLVETVS